LWNTLLDSSYKILAGDVNESGSVTTNDLVLIAALILARQTSWPRYAVWHSLPAAPIPAEVNLPALSEDRFVDFIGVKFGDLSGDVLLE